MTNEHLTLRAIEVVASAVMNSNERESYIVRGSFVAQEWMGDYRRPIKDLDLLYLKSYEPKVILCSIENALKNVTSELHFYFDEIIKDEIWKDTISPGIRLIIPFKIENIDSKLQVDIATGDPLVSPPVERQILLSNSETILLRTVCIEIAAAWKLHGLFEHLNGPWQSKTLWDLYILCRNNCLDMELFREAIQEAFSSRHDPMTILKRFLYGDFGKSRKSIKGWEKDLAEFGVFLIIPLQSVITWLAELLKPVLSLENDGRLLTLSNVITYRVHLLQADGSEIARKKLKTLSQKKKILPTKAYMSIKHIPGSRLGPSEKTIDSFRFELLTQSVNNLSDIVIVQEKLDGSCVCAFRKDDDIFALGREGDLANESPNESRRLWADWVELNKDRFLELLNDGERVCGEWLAMAHGTRYELLHEPLVIFDLFSNTNKAVHYSELKNRANLCHFVTPKVLHYGVPCELNTALKLLGKRGHHGAKDDAEGIIWRLERNQQVIIRAKYVSPKKIDGCYLTEITGQPIVWNWYPKNENEL